MEWNSVLRIPSPQPSPRDATSSPVRSRSCGGSLELAKKRGRPGGRRDDRHAVFQPQFREDLRYWVRTDRKVTLRAFELIEAILRDPFRGIGKPEPLKYLGPGVWSRRLTQEHRLVYLVSDDRIDFLQGRYHY